MTLRAFEFGIRFSSVDLEIQRPAVVRRCRRMARAAREDRNFLRRSVERDYLGHVVARRTA